MIVNGGTNAPPARRARVVALLALAGLLLGTALAPAALAQGRSLVVEGESGPYRIVAEAVPAQPVADLGPRFTVGLTALATGEPVADADVRLIMTDPSGDTRPDVPLLRNPNRPGIYAVAIILPDPGVWQFRVVAEGPLGVGTLDGEITALPPPASGSGGTLLWVSLVGAVMVAGGVLWLRQRRPRA